MNRQEHALINELFDRLASLEGQARDPEAVAAINEGLRRAPHALYPLVQTVLVQDEALKAANARIEELEGIAPAEPREQRGFLDSMRDSLFGRDEPRGSVPQVRPGDRPMGAPGSFGRDPWAQGQPQGYGQPEGYAQEPSRGGSFLGTAAAAAAGVLGGALLMNGIRSVLGGQGGPFQGAFDQLSGGSGASGSPWGGSGSSGDLARDAGLNDIGGTRSAGLFDGGRDSERAGLFGGGEGHADDNDFDGDDSDFGDNGGFDIGEA